MVITLIIIVIVFIVIKFSLDLNNQKKYIEKQGGMLMKYQLLVDNILYNSPGLNLEEETAHAITLASDDKLPGKTIIILTQTFGRLIIEWKVSNRYGKDNLEWEFDEFDDQDKILKKINHDIAEYNKKIVEARRKKVLKDLPEEVVEEEPAVEEAPGVEEVPEDIKPKNKINNRQRSLEEMARNMNTTPESVKNKYILQLNSKVNSHDEKTYLLKNIREKKIEEAKTKGIDHDDGIAALMEEWAKEYFNSVDFKIKINNEWKRSYEEYLDLPKKEKQKIDEFKWEKENYGQYYQSQMEISVRQIINAEKLLSNNKLSENNVNKNICISVYTNFMKIKHNVDIQIANVKKLNDEFYEFDVFLTNEDPFDRATSIGSSNDHQLKYMMGCHNWLDILNGWEDTYENSNNKNEDHSDLPF